MRKKTVVTSQENYLEVFRGPAKEICRISRTSAEKGPAVFAKPDHKRDTDPEMQGLFRTEKAESDVFLYAEQKKNVRQCKKYAVQKLKNVINMI